MHFVPLNISVLKLKFIFLSVIFKSNQRIFFPSEHINVTEGLNFMFKFVFIFLQKC